jgi:hypothetical protein
VKVNFSGTNDGRVAVIIVIDDRAPIERNLMRAFLNAPYGYEISNEDGYFSSDTGESTTMYCLSPRRAPRSWWKRQWEKLVYGPLADRRHG